MSDKEIRVELFDNAFKSIEFVSSSWSFSE